MLQPFIKVIVTQSVEALASRQGQGLPAGEAEEA